MPERVGEVGRAYEDHIHAVDGDQLFDVGHSLGALDLHHHERLQIGLLDVFADRCLQPESRRSGGCEPSRSSRFVLGCPHGGLRSGPGIDPGNVHAVGARVEETEDGGWFVRRHTDQGRNPVELTSPREIFEVARLERPVLGIEDHEVPAAESHEFGQRSDGVAEEAAHHRVACRETVFGVVLDHVGPPSRPWMITVLSSVISSTA